MERSENPFRGKVVEKFGTISAFADAMKWSGRKASYIVSGRPDLKVEEAYKCAEVLEIDDISEFLRIFMPKSPLNGRHEKGA